jgi:hypothetical protein
MTREPARHTDVLPEDGVWEESDIIFGMTNIGRCLDNRTPKEVGYLLNHTKLLDGVVKRVSHKVTIGSRKRLRNLAETILERD